VRFSPSTSPFPRHPRQQRAFSLVEVVLAIGVVAFAFVAILGLLPAGMSQFRKAIDTSVATDIAQRVIDDAQQTDWDTLTNLAWPSYRYFDERGVEVFPQSSGAATSAAALSPSEQAKIVYQVATRVQPLPYRQDGTQVAANTLAQITVQVLNNPGFTTPATSTTNVNLIVPKANYSVMTFSTQIAPSTFSQNSNL